MGDQLQLQIFEKYLDLLFKRHRLILASLLLALSAGSALYLLTPKVYRSTAAIIYQEQKINPSRFSPDEGKQVREMVNTVKQQVMSRTNLEKMIREFDLYPDLRQTAPIEDVIERMRNRDIEVAVHREKGNVFGVSFRGEDPRRVMRVTNALASKFIEENLRVREERAAETTSYINDELRMSKEILEKKEAVMRDYKLEYYNEMPGQQASNVVRLNALQEQFQAIQSSIHTLEQTRLLVSEQLGTRKRLQLAAAVSGDLAMGGDSTDALSEARTTLQQLRARYTEAHPAVRRQKKQIEKMEAERAALQELTGSEGTETRGDADSDYPRINELAIQLKEIDLNLKTLRNKGKEILGRIEKYQGWIDAAPVREAEWTALTRDYDELKKYHDALLAQSLAAEAAENLEMRQKGSQFKLVDPAYLPETPVKGRFLKYLLVSGMLGLAAGFGLVLGLDFFNPSFRSVREIEEALNIPVSGMLPLIATEAENRRQLIKNGLFYGFLSVWLLALLGATCLLWTRGAIIL